MPFGDYINREEAGPILMPEEVSNEIFDSVEEGSTVTGLATRLPNMASSTRRLPVLSALPNVYFVGEKGRSGQTFNQFKQTTEQAWENKYINAEEMAAIVVVPESVLDDAEFDVWTSVKPKIVEAIGAKIDFSTLFGESGVNVPAAWPDGLFVQMPASHKIAETGDLYEDILGEGGVLAAFEEDGYFTSGHIAALRMRSKLRGMKDENGNLIYIQDMTSVTPYQLDGTPLRFPRNGAFDPTTAQLLSGDFKQLVWAVRRDVRFEIFTTGVITTDANPPVITHNLLQEDLIALRVTFLMGWQLPNPINRIQPDADERFPFAALVPAGSS